MKHPASAHTDSRCAPRITACHAPAWAVVEVTAAVVNAGVARHQAGLKGSDSQWQISVDGNVGVRVARRFAFAVGDAGGDVVPVR